MKREVDVKQLLEWAYAVERVGASGGTVGLLEAERRASGVYVQGRSMTGALVDQAVLGARVAGGGGLNHCHDDAELVDRIVQRMLSHDERALVVDCALSSATPDWRPGARHRLEPRRKYNSGRTGHWNPEVCTHIPGRPGQVPAYCPVVEMDSPRSVERLRALYSTWREALFVVYAGLTAAQAAGLTSHVLVEKFPPATPWTDNSPLTVN